VRKEHDDNNRRAQTSDYSRGPATRLILAAVALAVALLAVAFVPALLASEVRRALAGLSTLCVLRAASTWSALKDDA
jgi:hypothetical protein